ncbi:glycine-rich domain-containing protein [Aurantibacillus circumpalustris]|uniref:glycine-rich domain-containing protein n=1 Tax=Aurantibacillus circumpalustris TaxID=3036359 RepID=UPI00295BEEF7|nr:hypothetical protein [Aurantibacillus circumpalustris]
MQLRNTEKGKQKENQHKTRIVLDSCDLNFSSDLDFEDINALNFELIKLQLIDKEEGEGWALSTCEKVEKEYKRFLALKRAFKYKDIIPNTLIDKFWNQHILHTKKYAEDCETIFGYFLHHSPLIFLNKKLASVSFKKAIEETKLLYQMHFGEEYKGFV